MNQIELIPSYWASVSGGKDSLFMLKLILSHPEKYPIDGVVHFELDIDFPFIHDVVDFMESECKKYSIPFLRIKPLKTWEECYYTKTESGSIWGFPTRKARWCNSMYKLSCKTQLEAYMREYGRSVTFYIGYCYDETKRYMKRNKSEIYPLVDFCYNESYILEWAKTVPLFNSYYISNKRCGCMYCPMASYITFAYLLKHYPENYSYMIDKMRETEKLRSLELGRDFAICQSNSKYNVDYIDNIVRKKYLPQLEYMENCTQLAFF